jgi:hypothetical protein
MATVQDITDLYGRIKRLHTRLADTSGDGFEWKVEVGEVIHSYHVSAMKSPKEIEDDIAALAVWLWSMKDYFQALLRSAGKDTMQVGLFVDTQSSLKLCSDIANSAKHLHLSHSKSGLFARAGKLQWSIPQAAVSSLVIEATSIQIDLSDPARVLVEMPILDRKGNVVGEGIAVCREATEAWERFAEGCGIVF